MAGVRVAARYSDAEPLALMPTFSTPKAIEVETDPDGLAVLDDIWTGKRLEVALTTWGRTWKSRRMAEGRLLIPPDEVGGVPIAIPPGGSLELDVSLPPQTVLRGRVFYADGRPVPHPVLSIFDLDEPAWDPERLQIQAQGDPEGGFEVRVPRGEERRRILVVAEDEKRRRDFVRYWIYAKHAGRLIVDPRQEQSKEIELYLEPVLSISGRVLSGDGTPARRWTVIRAVPSGSDYIATETGLGREAWANTDKSGEFRIEGLPPGPYDLYAFGKNSGSLRGGGGYGFSTGHRCYPGVAAGDEGLELVLPVDNVRIRVSAVSPYGEVANMTVHNGRIRPRRRLSPPSSPVPTSMYVDALTGWPESAPMSMGGVWGKQDEFGDHTYGYGYTEETEDHELRPMPGGWIAIGVAAEDPQGERYHPMSTGLLYLTPGEYHITFELVRTGTIDGRVQGVPPSQDLWACLLDDRGDPIPLHRTTGRQEPVHRVALRADGWFRLWNAPVGTHRLRIGTPSQLSQGHCLFEQSIGIEPGENDPVLIPHR